VAEDVGPRGSFATLSTATLRVCRRPGRRRNVPPALIETNSNTGVTAHGAQPGFKLTTDTHGTPGYQRRPGRVAPASVAAAAAPAAT
jgi:hypothetical protein